MSGGFFVLKSHKEIKGGVRMEYLRQTLSSTILDDIFNLPQSLRNKKVEVIILPAETDMPKKQIYEVRLGVLTGPPFT